MFDLCEKHKEKITKIALFCYLFFYKNFNYYFPSPNPCEKPILIFKFTSNVLFY